jgi:hypothetical protein
VLLAYALFIWVIYLAPHLIEYNHTFTLAFGMKFCHPFKATGIYSYSLVSSLFLLTYGALLRSQFTDPGIANKEIEYLELDRKINGA